MFRRGIKFVKSTFKWLLVGIFVYIFLTLVTPYVKPLRHSAIERQIAYLNQQFESGLADKMQLVYPEGKLFSFAIFELSLIEYFQNSNNQEIRFLIDQNMNRMLNDSLEIDFNLNLTPEYGAFYNGWMLWVMNEYLGLNDFNDPELLLRVKAKKDTLSINLLNAFCKLSRPLESHFSSVWPADNLVAMAALNVDYELSDFDGADIMRNFFNDEGEILHSLFEGENVRGSSTALSLYFLNQMKGLDCGQLTSNFRQKFVDNYFGVRLVKEYPDIGGEDFDSGPIIFGYGAVASIVNIKLMTKIGENPYPTLCLFNLLGIPISTWSYKFYLFGQEPMFDIFMLWNFVSID